MRSATRILVLMVLAITAAACQSADKPSRPSGGIAFVIGASTDPYGNSEPRGFGVASPISGRLRSVEVRNRPGPSAVGWLGLGRLVVSNSVGLEGSPAALFAFRGGRLERLGPAPLGFGERTFAWSPNRELIATQPWLRAPCETGTPRGSCLASSRTVFVKRSDGSDRHQAARGLLKGWSPDGRLLLFTGVNTDFAAGTFVTLDLRSGRAQTVLSSRQVAPIAHRPAQLGDLTFSGDRRYLAARVLLPSRGVGSWGVVVARADGSSMRLIRSNDAISMLAWSPLGHQLAYTTSGFPAPHELYLLSSPRANPRRILSQGEHFDWVTWSPDGHWLLIDNEHLSSWELLHLTGHREAALLGGASVPNRRLPRLGGMPLWCCPQQNYGGA